MSPNSEPDLAAPAPSSDTGPSGGKGRRFAPPRAGKSRRNAAPFGNGRERELPEYYITPTHDFTQYTKDHEEKYWSRDTAFDWRHDVPGNLRVRLESLTPEEFSRAAASALPMVLEALERNIAYVRRRGLPADDDALKAISGSIPSDCGAIAEAQSILAPLDRLWLPVARLNDQRVNLRREAVELRRQQRLKLVLSGTEVKRLESGADRRDQAAQLSAMMGRVDRIGRDIKQSRSRINIESDRLQGEVGRKLKALEPRVLADMKEARDLVHGTLQSGLPPEGAAAFARLQDLILKRQLHGLRDIANHALVVEQSAIAPLTMGVIFYKRRRELQEAMTTFISDEAKHSAVFRRFLAEKLGAEEHITASLVNGAATYMWLARLMPSGGIFLAVIIEAIGAAYLEFFANDEHMPDPLFRSICKTISERDERRHMDICAETYNELYRHDSRWERLRNDVALKVTMKSVYGDKNDDHYLIQAFRSFGVVSEQLYQHIAGRLSQQLARIGMHVVPERILHLIGRY